MKKKIKLSMPKRKTQRIQKHPRKSKRSVAWNSEAVIHQGVL